MTNVMAVVSFSAFMLASLPHGDDLTIWMQWGLAGVVVGLTLYMSWLRECRMSKELERQQEWTRTTLVKAIERNNAVLARLMERLGEKGERDE